MNFASLIMYLNVSYWIFLLSFFCFAYIYICEISEGDIFGGAFDTFLYGV